MKRIFSCILALCLMMGMVSGIIVTAEADDGFTYVETMKDLPNALSSAHSGDEVLVVSNTITTFAVTNDITVPQGITLHFGGDFSQVTINEGVTVTVNGKLTEEGLLLINGKAIVNGHARCFNGLTIASTGELEDNGEVVVIRGTFTNNGSMKGKGHFLVYPPELDTGTPVAINNTNFPDADFRQRVSRHYDTNEDGYITTDSFAQIEELFSMGPDTKNITGIKYFTGLKYLHLGGNGDGHSPLTSVDVSGLTNLEELYVGDSDLKSLNVTGCTKLKCVYVTDAKLYKDGIIGYDSLPDGVEIIGLLGDVAPDDPAPSGGCYVATCVYGSYDCPQVWTLRRFRDETLAKTWYGRAFIHTYYAISPTIVKWFGDTDWFKNMWRGTLDKMVENLNAKGVPNTAYDDIDW